MADGENGLVVVRQKGTRKVVRDRRLSEAIMRASELSRRARAMEPELSEARALIAGRAREFTGPGGTVSFEAGGVLLSVTARYEAVIPEDKVAEARRLLGRRFNELVRVKRKYRGTRGLLEEAGGPGGPLEGLIIMKEASPRFTWGAAA